MKKLILCILAFIFPLSVFAQKENVQIEWCTDTLATNYDIEATVHVQSMCEYPDDPIFQPAIQPVILTPTEEKPKPQNITWYFETSKVNHGATTWTMTLNLNLTGSNLNINKIQTWNKFTPVSVVTEDKKIIITLKQFDDKRLDVECTNYELTIPKNALTTENGDKNDEVITWNFIVENCPIIPANPDDTDNSWTGALVSEKDAELNSQSTYMPLIFRKDWVFYLDFKAFGLTAFYFFLIFSFWYIIFKFFKK